VRLERSEWNTFEQNYGNDLRGFGNEPDAPNERKEILRSLILPSLR
jgi:hypothetical protein